VVNGVTVGVMPGQDTVPGAPGSEWVHRSLGIPPALLHAGTNHVEVQMSGDVELDRLQIELAGDGAPTANGLFSDGFESGGLGTWSAKFGG